MGKGEEEGVRRGTSGRGGDRKRRKEMRSCGKEKELNNAKGEKRRWRRRRRRRRRGRC